MRKLWHKRSRQRQGRKMIKMSSNIESVSRSLLKRFLALQDRQTLDQMTREIAITTAGEMRERIHERGQDSSSGQIGTYTPPYLRFRQFGYKSKTVTRGAKKGIPRVVMNYNRTGDPNVILSLSRQMENDFTLGVNNSEPTKIPNGYGIGFKNSENFNKAMWNEQRYRKPIYNLTKQEKDNVIKIANDFINNGLKKI